MRTNGSILMVFATALAVLSGFAEPVNLYTAVTNAGLSLTLSDTRISQGSGKWCNGVTYAELIDGKNDPGQHARRVAFE